MSAKDNSTAFKATQETSLAESKSSHEPAGQDQPAAHDANLTARWSEGTFGHQSLVSDNSSLFQGARSSTYSGKSDEAQEGTRGKATEVTIPSVENSSDQKLVDDFTKGFSQGALQQFKSSGEADLPNIRLISSRYASRSATFCLTTRSASGDHI